uniref:Putative negative regulation of cyclin-dependent protein kinase n=1 Tax=Amblyomma sculptum TaxID=1581419 RepID=A0A1E1XR56_AMBSC
MGEVQTPGEGLVVGGALSTDGEQTTGNGPIAGSCCSAPVAPPSDVQTDCIGAVDLEAHREDEAIGPEKLVRSNSCGGRKKKNRRGKSKKRKWKPYYKLSWEERRELEERESRRANRLRQRMFAHGQPVAPYNTTQFLMEDHCVQEPDYESMNGHHRHRENSLNDSVDSSDEFYSSPEDEEDFLQKQFSEAYDDVHAERLNAMSKAELVQEYLLLEERVEELELKLRAARNARADAQTQTGADARPATDSEEQAQQKMAVFRDEIRKLADENALVRAHNRALREALDPSPAELS